MKVLAGIVNSKGAPAAARVSAASTLLDRGWGRPSQPLTGQDGTGPIIVQIIKPE